MGAADPHIKFDRRQPQWHRKPRRAAGSPRRQANLDGNTVAAFEIMLTGTRTLTAAGFVL